MTEFARTVPRIKKSKSTFKWGQQYYTALQDAVFPVKHNLYSTPEIPSKLADNIDVKKGKYACNQCGDSFHFQSSLDDHMARYSWILGYWCRHCTKLECTHQKAPQSNPSSSISCADCKAELKKRCAYFKARGLIGSERVGKILIFYNQCQFFGHLKDHGITAVDMCDMMLMPIPMTIQSDEYAQLDSVSRTLFECMFIKNIHIMDWLRLENVNFKWWTVTGSDDNAVGKLIRQHEFDIVRANRLIKSIKDHELAAINNVQDPEEDNDSNSDNYLIKNEENSPKESDLNEIEFVDCASLDDSLMAEAPPASVPSVVVKTEPPSSEPSTTGDLLKVINKPSAKLANLADINSINLNRNTVTHLINRNLKISSSNTLQTTTLSNITGAGKKNQIIIINKNKDNSDKSSEIKANVQILSNSGQDTVKLFKQAGGGRVFFQPGMKPVILKQVPKPLNASKLDGEKKYTVPKFSVVKNKLKILSGNSVPVTLVTSAQMLKSVSTLTTASSTLSTPSAAAKQTVLQIRDGSGLKTISVAPDKCTKLIPMEALHKPKEVLQKEIELLQKKNLVASGQIRQKSLINYTPQGQTVQLSSIPKGTKIVQTIQGGPKLVPVSQSSVKFPRTVQTYQRLQTVSKIGQNSPQTLQKATTNVAKIGKTLLKPIESLLKPEAQIKELDKKIEEDPLSCEAFPAQVQKVDRGPSILKLCAPDKKQNTVRAYREAMILSFQQSRKRVKPLIDNIIETNEIYKKTNVDVHSVMTVNEMALSKFKIYLENDRNVKMTDDDKINEELHYHLDNWEAKADNFNKYCERCHLKLKPVNYIVGISEPSEQENIYCQCYNHVCHLCNTRQGTLARYNVHMCFHMKEFPYTCPECFKKFPSIQHLEIHIWQQCYHIKTHQSWTCNVCEIEGFLTKEDLARHYFKIHSRSVCFCNLCRKKFDSFSEFRAHNSEVHGIINTQFSNASRLIKCNFGECLTKPEAFSEHVAAHVTVDKVTHYICPFCNFSMGEISINGHLIQRHVFKAHPERLKEVITSETLSVFVKMNLVSPVALDRPPSPSIKIVNAFPISSKAFNQQVNANSVEIINRRSDSAMPIKIIDVRTEKADEPVNHKIIEEAEEIIELPGSSLKIIDVTSMSRAYSSDEDDDKNKMIKNSIEKLSKLGVSLSAIKKNDKPKKVEDVGTHDEVSIINNFSRRKSSPPPLVLINNVNLLELDKEDDKKDVVQIECVKDNKVMIRNDLFNLEGVSIQRKSFVRKKQRLAMNGPLFKKEMVHYNCHLCGELINTNWYVINDHFREFHSAGYRIVSMTPCLRRLTNFEIMKYTGLKRSNSDLMLTPKKRRRGNYGPLFTNGKRLVDKFGGNNLGFCVTQESLQDVEGNFKCKKCNCLFKDVNVLREHLASNHRIRGHYLVCLECGDNFIVASTLQMHLKAFHGINDPISYLQKNTAYAPDALDEIEEQDKITESNQCYVCFAVFENKLAVDMHLRVHGMAFLNRKRIEARKALKCPQKFKAASPTPKPEEIKIDDCEDDNANVVSMSGMV